MTFGQQEFGRYSEPLFQQAESELLYWTSEPAWSQTLVQSRAKGRA